MKMLVAVVLASLIAMSASSQAWGQAQEPQGPWRAQRAAPTDTDQVIVKWRESAKATLTASAAQRASKLSLSSGMPIRHKRRSTATIEVFQLERSMSGAELQAVLDRLNADPDVVYAVADKRRRIQQIPSDNLAMDQWYFLSVQPAATRTDQAWDITTGDASTVVAVLDSGVLPTHPDLVGKLEAGYDFVSNVLVANDDDGRDADPTDPGDFIVASDRSNSIFNNCGNTPSSWHGTRVASLIGGGANNDGIVGAGWDTRILPVRVLGKCGGFDSDIIDGMRWAAGLLVADVPPNGTPAKIINMSLGADDDCSAAYQDAVSEVTAQGSLIVASAGNDGIPVSSPANCPGVLAVGGIRHVGTKVGYSNLGPEVAISAPAGNCVNPGPPYSTTSPCVFPLHVATNSGDRGPEVNGYSDTVANPNIGTSFSAPLVAGAAALMHAVNPQLTPTQFTTLLKESAMPFPISSSTTTAICRIPTTFVQGNECICTTVTCGAGMLNTFAAVNAALKPFGIVQGSATIDPNVSVPISGDTSFGAPGRTISSYQWSVLNVTGATPAIADIGAASTTLQVAGNSRFTLRLSVTDDAGGTDSTDFAMVTSTPPEPQTPPPSTPIGTGGGGGGSFDWWLLVLGLLPLALSGPRRRRLVSNSPGRGPRRRRRQNFLN